MNHLIMSGVGTVVIRAMNCNSWVILLRAMIQNLATRRPSTRNVKNTVSDLELEMNIIAPQSADTDSVEATERDTMEELQIRAHLQGEHNRMNRLRCRIIDNKNAALSFKETIDTLTNESKSKNLGRISERSS